MLQLSEIAVFHMLLCCFLQSDQGRTLLGEETSFMSSEMRSFAEFVVTAPHRAIKRPHLLCWQNVNTIFIAMLSINCLLIAAGS